MKNLKSIILRGVFTLSLILCVSSVKAQEAVILPGIEKITEIDQISRYGTKELPADIMEHIVGYYRNIDNDNGLPFVQINNDNTGIFQIHNYEEHPITDFWILTDEKGKLLIERGIDNPNYRIYLIAKYDYSGLKKKDVEFGRIPVTINLDNKRVYIFGERVKDL
ncbi:MAG: hypothetical protein WBA61_17075 [Aequorivita sp.]